MNNMGAKYEGFYKMVTHVRGGSTVKQGKMQVVDGWGHLLKQQGGPTCSKGGNGGNAST